jgi:hypothetical protein
MYSIFIFILIYRFLITNHPKMSFLHKIMTTNQIIIRIYKFM